MKWYFFRVEHKRVHSLNGNLHYSAVYRIHAQTAEEAEGIVKKETEGKDAEEIVITPCESYRNGDDYTRIILTDAAEASEEYRALAYEEMEITGRLASLQAQMASIRKGMTEHMGGKRYRIHAGVLWECDDYGTEATAAELEMEPDFSHQNQ